MRQGSQLPKLRYKTWASYGLPMVYQHFTRGLPVAYLSFRVGFWMFLVGLSFWFVEKTKLRHPTSRASEISSNLAFQAMAAHGKEIGHYMDNLWIYIYIYYVISTIHHFYMDIMDNLWIWLIYPLAMTNIAIEHGSFIVDFHMKHGDFPQLC